MSRVDKLLIVSWCVLVTCFLVLIFTDVRDAVRAYYQPTPSSTPSECYLPCKCAPYYNLGTSEWRECMGVEYK